MKFLILTLAVIATQAFAQPEILAPLVCSSVTTSTVPVTASSLTVSAYVNALKIVVSDSKTCTVTISSGLETIYSSAAATGTVILRPVAQNSTNGVDVASFSKVFLASDKLTVSAHTITDSGSATVTVIPVIERLP